MKYFIAKFHEDTKGYFTNGHRYPIFCNYLNTISLIICDDGKIWIFDDCYGTIVES